MKKRLLSLTLALAIVTGSVALAAGVEKTITVSPMALTVDGQAVTPTKSNGEAAEVFAYDGVTYAPVRYLCDLLGIEVEWDKSNPNTTNLVGLSDAPKGGNYQPGTYTAAAQGFGGEVTVEVTVSATAITAVKASGAGETAGIGSRALETLPDSFVQANSAEVDNVSGATYTSTALKEALTAALAQAMGQSTAGGTVADGRYTVNMIGHEGTVVVSTVFKDGKILSVTVPSNNETVAVGTYAVERIPARIVENQSINVEAVSGATVTSNVIKQGVAEAIKQAGGSVADFNKEIKAPVKEQQVEEHVQVAIMGSGTAGLFTAARLLEEGVKDIIIFEKTDIPGGCMPLTYGGIFNTDSQVYANWAMGREKGSTQGEWEARRASLAKRMDPEAVAKDPELTWLKQMYYTAGWMTDWMTENGVGMMTLGVKPMYNYAFFAPGCYSGGAGFATQWLEDRITYQGGRIIYATPVTDLIQDNSGRITGLVAEGRDGTTWTVHADAVVLAAGSFAKDDELVAKYFPEMAGKYLNAPASLTGDGLKLGMKYGAGIEDMGSYVPGFLATYDSHFELAFMHYTTPGIIVNINGDQFGNITADNHGTMSRAKADPANGDTFYFIFDDAGAAQTRNYDDYLMDTYEGIFEKGEAIRYDSLEEASAKLNLPNLASTIATNNALALQGPDAADAWGRKSLPYIDTKTGVWAVRVDPNYYLPTGGLCIDHDTHVLTQEGKVIPGLYAAGDVVGSIEQKQGKNYGAGFVAAMSFGASSAQTIAAELK